MSRFSDFLDSQLQALKQKVQAKHEEEMSERKESSFFSDSNAAECEPELPHAVMATSSVGSLPGDDALRGRAPFRKNQRSNSGFSVSKGFEGTQSSTPLSIARRDAESPPPILEQIRQDLAGLRQAMDRHKQFVASQAEISFLREELARARRESPSSPTGGRASFQSNADIRRGSVLVKDSGLLGASPFSSPFASHKNIGVNQKKLSSGRSSASASRRQSNASVTLNASEKSSLLDPSRNPSRFTHSRKSRSKMSVCVPDSVANGKDDFTANSLHSKLEAFWEEDGRSHDDDDLKSNISVPISQCEHQRQTSPAFSGSPMVRLKSDASDATDADPSPCSHASTQRYVAENRLACRSEGHDVDDEPERPIGFYSIVTTSSEKDEKIRELVANTVVPVHALDTIHSIEVSKELRDDVSERGCDVVFNMLEAWSAAEVNRSGGSMQVCHTASAPEALVQSLFAYESEAAEGGNGSSFVLLPKSIVRLVWDALSIFFVCYDAFVLPLYFLEMEDNVFTVMMTWLTRLFWTLDIPMTCITGYTAPDGHLETRLRLTAMHYFRTWFALDAALVGLDWAQQLVSEVLSAAGKVGTKTTRVGRILRLVRIVRLIRVARIVKVVVAIFEHANLSEKLSIIASITLSLTAIVALMHIIGCTWYGLGASSNNGWVNVQNVKDEPFWTRYGHSLFWATGIFTQALDPMPNTGEERTFITFILFFSFVVVTCFISSFTSSLTQFTFITNSGRAQFSVLRRYMKQHSISPRLCLRVTRNAKHILREKQNRTPEEDVELLRVISEPLRKDLHHEVYSKILARHPLFRHFGSTNLSGMKRTCHTAIRFYNFSQGDILFSPGEIPPCQLLLLYDGECRYLRAESGDDMEDFLDMRSAVSVFSGKWICEPALWTRWVYRGLLRASVDCEVMVVLGDELMAVNAADRSRLNLTLYGNLYVDALNEFGNMCSDLVDDIDPAKLVGLAYYGDTDYLTAKMQSEMQDLPTETPGPVQMLRDVYRSLTQAFRGRS